MISDMRSAREHVMATLADGAPHSCTDLADGIAVTRNAVQQAVSRLGREGVPIVCFGESYQIVATRHCLACNRRLSRYNRTSLCHEHRHERKRRQHQQMVLSA